MNDHCSTDPQKGIILFVLTGLIIVFVQTAGSLAAPPNFNPIGEQRLMNTNLFVIEGHELIFTISATDPDGDALTYSVDNLPDWAEFDSTTGQFSGTAPYWADDYDTRKEQKNVYDVTFRVSDGLYTVDKIVSIYVLDAGWGEKPVMELVANRPIIAGGEIGTAVDVSDIQEQTIESGYGGGKTLRKISFAFTSQVPDVEGWEDDWVSTVNYLFLPQNLPAAQNVGAIVEGGYSQNFGETELAERACAELDIPVLIIDRGWEFEHAGNLMEKYDSLAVVKREPEYLFYTFTAAHYLRAIDAFVTILKQKTDWPVTYGDFRVIFTGHSKMGHTCHNAAAADPERVAGFMANGSSILDTGASRLLGTIQHARGTKPEAFLNYRAVMMRYYFESLKIESQMAPDVKALIIQGTDDDKNRDTGYTPKYIMLTADAEMTIPHAIGCLANAPHTTQTPLHPVYWSAWIAHCFLDRPIAQVDSVFHHFHDGVLTVYAKISAESTIHDVYVWASGQNDQDISNWNTFADYTMTQVGDIYQAEIPAESRTYFIEIREEAGGVRGLVASPPMPVNKDYPLLPQSPGTVKNFQAQTGPSGLVLNWTNPQDDDFIGTVIRCRTDGFPATPMEGELVYDGTATSAAHNTTLENDMYYAAFCYDAFGNYSSGAFLCVESTTGIENAAKTTQPRRFVLFQNYPNPFNPTTTIRYELAQPGKVEISIYNVLGEKIKTLVNEEQQSGVFTVTWDGTDSDGNAVSSGVFYYQLIADDYYSGFNKMTLLK